MFFWKTCKIICMAGQFKITLMINIDSINSVAFPYHILIRCDSIGITNRIELSGSPCVTPLLIVNKRLNFHCLYSEYHWKRFDDVARNSWSMESHAYLTAHNWQKLKSTSVHSLHVPAMKFTEEQ